MLPENIILNFVVMLACFYVLAKGADFLVEGAVGIATRFRIPKMIIGIVLVGFATTAPEFTVTMISAIQGVPDIALGNAVGSVIANDGLALAMGIIIAPMAIRVNSKILKTAGLFLIVINILAFILSFNGYLSRWEGAVLLFLLVVYLAAVIIQEKRRKKSPDAETEAEASEEVAEHTRPGSLGMQILRFFIGVAMVAAAGKFLVDSAINIARFFAVPEVVIGLSIVAIGTSLPEIATCIVAARKGHGDLALGDIIGADILNILWIIGGASVVSTITVERSVILFSFPAMIAVVLLMLFLSRLNYRLEKWKGYLLLFVYLIYFFLMIFFLYLPEGKELLQAAF